MNNVPALHQLASITSTSSSLAHQHNQNSWLQKYIPQSIQRVSDLFHDWFSLDNIGVITPGIIQEGQPVRFVNVEPSVPSQKVCLLCDEEIKQLVDDVRKFFERSLKQEIYSDLFELYSKKEGKIDKGLLELPNSLSTPENFVAAIPNLLRLTHSMLIAFIREPSEGNILAAKKTLESFRSFYSMFLTDQQISQYSEEASRQSVKDISTSLRLALENRTGLTIGRDLFFKIRSMLLLQSELKKHVLLQLRDQLILKEAHKIMSEDIRFSEADPEKVIKLLSITWMHGSKLSVVEDACHYSDGFLMPLGELLKKNQLVMTGEQELGADEDHGINRDALSGVSLPYANIAVKYAKEYDNYSLDAISNDIDSFLSNIDQFACTHRWYNDDKLISSFYRIAEKSKMLKHLDPKKFLEKKSKLSLAVSKVEECIQTSLQEKTDALFDHTDWYHKVLMYKNIKGSQNIRRELEREEFSHSGRYSSDHEIKRKIPLLFASNTAVGIPIHIHLVREPLPEDIYPGSLKLGKDIQFVFTTPESVELVKETVKKEGLDQQVQVETFETLELARILERKLRAKLCNLFDFSLN